MRWEQKVQYASLSDIGFRRRNNQDSCVVVLSPDAETFRARGHLFIVADGMGGHAVGELASKLAVDTIPQSYFKNRSDDIPIALNAAILEANAVIHERGSQNIDFNRMGTTCVALALGPNGGVAGHVGDSRLYRIRRDQIEQLTFDHSLEWELVRYGRLKPNDLALPDAKHVITRSIGPESEVEPEIDGPFSVWPGDIFLLCSDGLTGLVNDAEIGAIAKHLPEAEACRLLVHLANLRGGPDNITVIIAQVGPLPEGTAPQPGEAPTMGPENGELDQLSWFRSGGLLLCVLTFVLGIVWAMVNEAQRDRGIVLSVLSVVAAGVWTWMWRKPQAAADHEPRECAVSAMKAKAYRTASAKLLPEFLVTLAKLQDVMKEAAQKENWSFDAEAHAAADRAAKQACDKKQWSASLREVANGIDLLMSGMINHRRSAKSESEQVNPIAILNAAESVVAPAAAQSAPANS